MSKKIQDENVEIATEIPVSKPVMFENGICQNGILGRDDRAFDPFFPVRAI
jgi:hypothetical protein